MTMEMIWPPLLGGVLIGLASLGVLLFYGKIAGISGVLGGALVPRRGDWEWRYAFIAGMLFGGGLLLWLYPAAFPSKFASKTWVYVVAGLLVGFGTRLGNGCTSGHGVCGMSRLSPRSIMATLTFIAAGAATVYVVQHVLGGV